MRAWQDEDNDDTLDRLSIDTCGWDPGKDDCDETEPEQPLRTSDPSCSRSSSQSTMVDNSRHTHKRNGTQGSGATRTQVLAPHCHP